MGLFKNRKKINDMDLKTAYRLVYDDLCNDEKPLLQGIFDPDEKDEEYLHGIGYVLTHIGIKAYKSDLTVVPKKFSIFTSNILRSCIKHGILPRFKLCDEHKALLIRKLRSSNDKVLNFLADNYETNRVIIKMCDAETMYNIAAGKAEYPLVESEE